MVTLLLRQLDIPPGQLLLLHDISWSEFEWKLEIVAIAVNYQARSPTCFGVV